MLSLLFCAQAQEPPVTPPVDPVDPVDVAPPVEPVPQEPPVEPAPPVVYQLQPVPDLPSAVRSFQQRADSGAFDADGDGTLDEVLGEGGGLPALVRGAWFVRPRLAFQQLVRDGEDGSAVRLGVSAGHRWWTLEALPVQLAADVGLRATAPVGEGVGRRVEAFGHIGPWLGPVRVELGAVLRWEQEQWLGKSLRLDDALHLGPELGVGFDAKLLQLAIGVAPTWRLAGDRAPASSGTPVFPTFAHETTWWATIGLPLAPIGFVVDTSWRDTAIGGSLEVGLSLRLALGEGE